jgi:hypothetical protein
MLLFVLGAGAVGWLAGESLRRGRQVGDSDRLGQYEPPRPSWQTLHTRIPRVPMTWPWPWVYEHTGSPIEVPAQWPPAYHEPIYGHTEREGRFKYLPVIPPGPARLRREPLIFSTRDTPATLTMEIPLPWARVDGQPVDPGWSPWLREVERLERVQRSQDIYRQMQAHPSKLRPRKPPASPPTPAPTPMPGRPMGIVPPYLRRGGLPGIPGGLPTGGGAIPFTGV